MPMDRKPATVVLADGTRFYGVSVGADGIGAGELVFTTGMTGYQEVLTDPSYAGQIVTMTSPQIGNTGTNEHDDEAARPALSGLIVRELSELPSSFRSTEKTSDYLKRHGIVCISDVDTRALTRHIRDHGAQLAAMGSADDDALEDVLGKTPSMLGQNLTREVTTGERYEWKEGEWRGEHVARAGENLHVVAIDYGIKRNILRCLSDRGLRITVVPCGTSAEEVLALSPDGVFLSNGPGDPAAVDGAEAVIRELLGTVPLFGICLGHQLLCLALGAQTFKLKFGHRGLNHPVKNIATGGIEITTQNHGFAVDLESLPERLVATHVHLNDGTCMGVRVKNANAFSVQYHPESGAGTHDSRYLFDDFVAMMRY